MLTSITWFLVYLLLSWIFLNKFIFLWQCKSACLRWLDTLPDLWAYCLGHILVSKFLTDERSQRNLWPWTSITFHPLAFLTLYSNLSNLIRKVHSFLLWVHLDNSQVHPADIKHNQNISFFFSFFLTWLILTKYFKKMTKYIINYLFLIGIIN